MSDFVEVELELDVDIIEYLKGVAIAENTTVDYIINRILGKYLDAL